MKIFYRSVLFAAVASASAAHAQTAMTIAQLQASTACSAPVFITDPGKEGMFVASSDSSLKLNGGTTLACGTNNKLYKRVYDSVINAKWFGLSEAPNVDNSKPVQDAIDSARNGQEVLIPEGNYQFQNSILLRDQTYIHFTSRGSLTFGARDGIIVQGLYGHVVNLTRLHGRPWEDHPTYGYVGSGITLMNAQFATVKVNWIDGFQNAIKVSASGTQGSQYNKIDFEGLKHNDVGILLTTENDGYIHNWVTENTFVGGKITGVTGILSAPGPGADSFNGNKFYNIGFEGLTTAVDATGFRNNVFFAPRLLGPVEGVLSGFKFGANSYGNVIFSTAIYENSFSSNGSAGNAGVGTLLVGSLVGSGDRLSGVLSISDANGRFLSVTRDLDAQAVIQSKSRVLPLSSLKEVSP